MTLTNMKDLPRDSENHTLTRESEETKALCLFRGGMRWIAQRQNLGPATQKQGSSLRISNELYVVFNKDGGNGQL